MNTPTPHLWKLIKGLTPAEKRYFKTHFASSGNQLTLLFDTLNNQEVHDELAALELLDVKATQFKVLKHQLQDLIMKSWVANSSKRSIKSRIRIGLEEVDLLLEREHFAEASKKLVHLERLCGQYGFTLYHYEVRERLHEVQHLELDFSDPEANHHYEELVHLQRVLHQKQQLSAIQQKLEDWNSFTPARHKVLKELKKTLEGLKAEYMDLSSWMAWIQNMTICAELLGDEQTATNYREQIMEIYEQEPSLKENLPLGYLTALKHAGLLRRARGTLLRRATDPWESHLGGIMNTLVPEPEIPSHQGPDAQSVSPDLDVITMAVKVPETLAHLHYWSVQLTRPASKDEVLNAFSASSRIALIRTDAGLTALNTVKELMADLGRPHDNLYEVALWSDMLKVEGDELFYAYMVDNQAIVIPETIDAIRALTGTISNAEESIAKTNASLGIGLLPEALGQ
jgi:hypothetical protein